MDFYKKKNVSIKKYLSVESRLFFIFLIERLFFIFLIETCNLDFICR